ncbi:MAG: hypothetical protein ACK5VI_07505 [Opitutia bacterium]
MSPAVRCLLLATGLTGVHLVGLQLSQALVSGASPADLNWTLDGPFRIFLWLAVPTALAQAAALALPAPDASAGASPSGLMGRAATGAIVLSLAIALPVFALADLPYWLDAEVGPVLGNTLFQGLMLGLGASWIGLSLLLAHRSKGKPDLIERRVAQATAGTLVGLALATPWYLVLRRKQQCFCSLGTFWALLVGLWSLVLVGGPLLLLLARERRTRAALRA